VLAAALVVTVTAAAGVSSPAEPARAQSVQRPNIILVVTDDQTLAQLSPATMPDTLELLGAQGTTFANTFAVTPLCCPSRAAMITGQYGHNNGVLANRPGYADLTAKRSVLPAWLDAAGYTTAHVGRWLNGFRKAPGKRPAPGWEEWFTLGESRTYFDYDLLSGREQIHFGKGSRDYVTRVLNQAALRVVRSEVGKTRPFYLQLDHLAPHSDGIKGDDSGACVNSAIPPSRSPTGFETTPLPQSPSFNESDISDKPPFVRILPPLDGQRVAELERQYRCRLASLPAVDEGVRRIVETLAQAGELDNTAIAFVSDNGYFFGEHRVPTEKYLAYEEAIRIPMLIRFPGGLGAGATVDAPAANIDIAPTLLELAGATPCARGICRVLDGRSLLGLAQGDYSGWPQSRELLIELRRNAERPSHTLPCAYAGVRTPGEVYVEYSSLPNASGACVPAAAAEHYDLAADPFELDNLFPAEPGSPAAEAQAALARRVAELRDCSGIAGRDPLPPSGHYCE